MKNFVEKFMIGIAIGAALEFIMSIFGGGLL